MDLIEQTAREQLTEIEQMIRRLRDEADMWKNASATLTWAQIGQLAHIQSTLDSLFNFWAAHR